MLCIDSGGGDDDDDADGRVASMWCGVVANMWCAVFGGDGGGQSEACELQEGWGELFVFGMSHLCPSLLDGQLIACLPFFRSRHGGPHDAQFFEFVMGGSRAGHCSTSGEFAIGPKPYLRISTSCESDCFWQIRIHKNLLVRRLRAIVVLVCV